MAAANDLLDPQKVPTLPPAKYAEAVKAAKDINARDWYGRTALHIAARYGNPEQIKGRHIRGDIEVYLSEDGELYFG